MLGAIVGAGIVYANYSHAIDVVEGGQRTLKTAGIFGTYPVWRRRLCSIQVVTQ
jgi:aquaglyceroporin related protein